MRTIIRYTAAALIMAGAPTAASAARCSGNADALGTARTLTLDPVSQDRIGTIDYWRSLPLRQREVVLTFDGGPRPGPTARVLDALARECVKATFFLVGAMARSHPDLVRRIFTEGHVIGTQTQSQPRRLGAMPLDEARREIDLGITSVAGTLGSINALAPFFRFPGLNRSQALETELRQREIAIWSADIDGDHEGTATPARLVARVMDGLERHGKGIVLLHDASGETAEALPHLLRRLRAGGYRIVQAVPPGYGSAASASMAAHEIASVLPRKRPAPEPSTTSPATAAEPAATPEPAAKPAADSAAAFAPLPPGLPDAATGAQPDLPGADPHRDASPALPESVQLPPDDRLATPLPPAVPAQPFTGPAEPPAPDTLHANAEPAVEAPNPSLADAEPHAPAAIAAPKVEPPGPAAVPPVLSAQTSPAEAPGSAETGPMQSPEPETPAPALATAASPAPGSERLLIMVPGAALAMPPPSSARTVLPFMPLPMPSLTVSTSAKVAGPRG